MSDKNIEMMKKLIEEKKKKSPEKSIGSISKGSSGNKKTGGLFDKD